MITKRDLLDEFDRMGARGRLVMFHSSYKSFGGVEGGAQAAGLVEIG